MKHVLQTRAPRLRPWILVALAAALPVALSMRPLATAATQDKERSPPVVDVLMTRQLVNLPGKEAQLATVAYLPGGASMPHQHHAQVFVYMLSGKMRMQVKGGPEVILGPGETFYEAPDDVHVVSANASATEPAKFVVFMVQDKAAP